MKTLIENGNDERRYLSHHISSPKESIPLDVITPFACMVWDGNSNSTVDEMSQIAEQVLEKGCRSVVCGGSKCELWHDIFDEVIVEPDIDGYIEILPDYPLVMTTWHTDEVPEEVAFYLVNCATFDELVFADYVLLTVGDEGCIKPVESALTKCALYLD